jgi:hypothetical protein
MWDAKKLRAPGFGLREMLRLSGPSEGAEKVEITERARLQPCRKCHRINPALAAEEHYFTPRGLSDLIPFYQLGCGLESI